MGNQWATALVEEAKRQKAQSQQATQQASGQRDGASYHERTGTAFGMKTWIVPIAISAILALCALDVLPDAVQSGLLFPTLVAALATVVTPIVATVYWGKAFPWPFPLPSPAFFSHRPHIWYCFGTAAMMLVAIAEMPHGYYQLLRVVNFIACILVGCIAFGCFTHRSSALFFLGILAVMFNPVFPLTMEREEWQWMDAGAAILWTMMALFWRRH